METTVGFRIIDSQYEYGTRVRYVPCRRKSMLQRRGGSIKNDGRIGNVPFRSGGL